MRNLTRQAAIAAAAVLSGLGLAACGSSSPSAPAASSAPADRTLAPTQAWFAIWVRVENDSSQATLPSISITRPSNGPSTSAGRWSVTNT